MKLVHSLTAAAVGFAVLASVGSAPANAANFNFSFSNVNGGTPGTVEGNIVLPDGDGTFAATGLTVTSAPAALGYTTPYDVLANLPTVYSNIFTVVSGAINPTSSVFAAQNNTEAFTLNYASLGSILSIRGAADATTGVWDSKNATLTYASPVPEPTTVGAAIASGAGLIATKMKQRKKQKAQAA